VRSLRPRQLAQILLPSKITEDLRPDEIKGRIFDARHAAVGGFGAAPTPWSCQKPSKPTISALAARHPADLGSIPFSEIKKPWQTV
jgi:hypothetical protein